MFNSTTRIHALLSASIALAGCSAADASDRAKTLPYYDEPSFTPRWLSAGSAELKAFHRVPPFRLTNQRGEVVTEQDYRGKIYIADFFFTTCGGICPKMTANLRLVQDAFQNDDQVRLLSHSVTPGHDTADVLRAYAAKHNIDGEKWNLLTGDRGQIYALGRKAYFVEEDLGEAKSEDDFLHTENFVLVDREGHLRGIYNGLNKTAVSQLIQDIKTLKNER